MMHGERQDVGPPIFGTFWRGEIVMAWNRATDVALVARSLEIRCLRNLKCSAVVCE